MAADTFLPAGGPPHFRREDVIWAAGLFEGEGCVSLKKANKRSKFNYVFLQLKMTDRAVVEKFKDVFGFGAIRVAKVTNAKWNDTYDLVVCNFEGVQAICAAMWPWLGERRREVIASALKEDGGNGSKRSWGKKVGGGLYNLKGHTHCINGHPYTDDNVFIGKRGPDGTVRRCKACLRATSARTHERRKLQQKEAS